MKMQLHDENYTRKSVVLGVDVGTTNIRCIAYDQSANVLGKAQEKVILIPYAGLLSFCLSYYLLWTFQHL